MKETKELMLYMKSVVDNKGVLYVHCWVGVGRTGTIVSCWFVFNGLSANDSLKRLNVLWKECPKSVRRKHCPEYTWQEQSAYEFEKYLNNNEM